MNVSDSLNALRGPSPALVARRTCPGGGAESPYSARGTTRPSDQIVAGSRYHLNRSLAAGAASVMPISAVCGRISHAGSGEGPIGAGWGHTQQGRRVGHMRHHCTAPTATVCRTLAASAGTYVYVELDKGDGSRKPSGSGKQDTPTAARWVGRIAENGCRR